MLFDRNVKSEKVKSSRLAPNLPFSGAHYKTMNTGVGLMHCAVCLLTSQLSLVATHCAKERPGWVVAGYIPWCLTCLLTAIHPST